MCFEMFGMSVAEDVMYFGILGAVIGAVLTGYVLYVVAKIRHDDAVAEAVNDARIAGEEYPEWKVKKAATWYKGYKLALLADIVMGVVIGLAAALTMLYMGKVHGTLDTCAVAFLVAIVGGWIIDAKMIHPIADNRFFENVEQPLVDALFQPAAESVTQAIDGSVSPEILALVEELKRQGKI